MLCFYCRCSTIEQNEARQVAMAEEHNAGKIYIDKASGKDTNREELIKMMNFVREGDIVMVESISRIARNTRDLLNIIDELSQKGVAFVSIKESIDTNTATGKFMLTVFGAMAELERAYILDRQAQGISIAKENGVYKGKQPMKINEDAFSAAVAEWRKGSITAVEAMKRCGLKPNTFYRRVKERGL